MSPPTNALKRDTPPTFKANLTGDYRAGTLNMARATVTNELDYVPYVSYDLFKSHILPPVRGGSNHVNAIYHSLVADREYLPQEGWSAMKAVEVRAREHTIHETDYYRPLEAIHHLITGRSHQQTTTKYTVCGDRNLDDDRANTSRPDASGYLVLNEDLRVRNTQAKHNWVDIVRCDEYKKSDTTNNFNGDAKKLCWNAHHVLRADPRRRFLFGLTIEGRTTRVWHFNRQTALVSEPFDYMMFPEHFIHLVLSLAHASQEELGFDMTMKYVPESEPAKYDININNKTYSTSKVISDFAVDALRGRATRVFAAHELGEEQNEVVIKDSWVDQDRQREGTIMATMLKDATDEQKKYFLTVLAHGDVVLKSTNIRDNTQRTHMRGFKINETTPTIQLDPFAYPSNTSSSEGPTPERNVPPRALGVHAKIVYQPKTHYRIVFKENCIAIKDLFSWTGILEALAGTAKGLEVMCKLGNWVHRDISSGNILIYEGQVKIADLEFAKISGSGGKHDIRTGTPDTMAVETQQMKYQFYPELMTKPFRQRQSTPFFHNCLHDLESLWWLFTWFLFWRVPKGLDTEDGILKKQHSAAQDLFLRDRDQRLSFFSRKLVFDELLQTILPHYQDMLGNVLLEIRIALLQQYQDLEKDLLTLGTLNTTNLDKAHSQVYTLLQSITVSNGEEETVHLTNKILTPERPTQRRRIG